MNDSTRTGRQWPPANARRGFGLALLGLATGDRFLAGDGQPLSSSAETLPARPALDVLLGLVDVVLEVTETAADLLERQAGPVVSVAVEPARDSAAGLSGALVARLVTLTEGLAERGARLRAEAEDDAVSSVAQVLPESLDLVLDQVDLTDQAISRIDFDRVLRASFEQVDMEDLMIENVDLERIVRASLDQVDLTQLALERLDLERVVKATLEQVDVFSLAREQVDPVRVAAYLRDNVDLAEVLRSAPGGAVRGVFDTVGKMVPGRP